METQTLESPVTELEVGVIEKIQDEFCAVRLTTSRIGINKKLNDGQQRQTADVFEAEKSFVRATKKIVDTKSKPWRAVTKQLAQAKRTWVFYSVQYPLDGIRLIRKDKVEVFTKEMEAIQKRIDAAVIDLNLEWPSMIEVAKEKLGNLFDESDYPTSLDGQFSFAYDFPSVDPPNYLKELSPKLYEEQVGLLKARVAEAIEIAEAAFAEELGAILESLTQKLTESDGKKQVRSNSIGAAMAFFQRFEDLNVCNSKGLKSLVGQCKSIISGIDVKSVKKDVLQASTIKAQLAEAQDALNKMIVDAPSRKVIL